MNETIITIDKLKRVFLSEVTTDGRYVDYLDASDFTKKVAKSMRTLGKECDVNYQAEYYDIDYTFWGITDNEELTIPKTVGMNNNWNWNLLALVEHENNPNDWHYEVQKLAPFRCPLRVVIGYRNKNYTDEERLDCVAGLLQTMKMNHCFCDEGEFWVGIGNNGHSVANYIFYRYNASTGKFEKVLL